MIKNYHMVREAEMDYQSIQKFSLEERLRILDEMYIFSKRFSDKRLSHEKSQHVKMLINLTNTFKKLGKLKNA